MGAILSRADLRRTATNMLIVGGLSIFIKHAHNVVMCDQQDGGQSMHCPCLKYVHLHDMCIVHCARHVHVHDSSRVKC